MKIKSKINILIGGIVTLSLLGSCTTDDFYEFPSAEKPIVTPTGGTEFTVIEGETLNIPFTTSQAISEPMTFKFTIVDTSSATASENIDYTVGQGPISSSEGNPATMFYAEIPAYTENFEIPFTALEDLMMEGTETVQLRMEASTLRTALTQDGGIVFTFNIDQVVSDELVINLSWPGTYTGTDGATHPFTDYDLDILIYDAAGTTLVNLEGATAASPEQVVISPGELPDGDYLLVIDYYSAPDNPVDTSVANPESIPAVLMLVKPGVFNETIDFSGVYTDFSAGSSQGNQNATIIYANLNIQGTTYTISDADSGEVIVQGRSKK